MANKDVISGCINGPGANGAIVLKPLVFLGGTVLSFNASLGIGPTQESTLNVELINDCALRDGLSVVTDPNGEFFSGQVHLGGPVFFSTHEALGLAETDPGVFKFGGILANYTAQQGSNGLTFNAKVVDPRSLLGNVTLVIGSTLQGPIKHWNYYNLYSYYEQNALSAEDKDYIEWPSLLLPSGPYPQGMNPAVTPRPGSRCDVFGTANSDSRGMSYKSILAAIQNINPFLVYSPNYNRNFNPLNAQEAALAAGNLNHEENVFRLDISELLNLPIPKYFRAPGPSITMLDLITEVCDAVGHEFIVTLEKSPPGQFHVIKVKTKDVNQVAANFGSTIIAFNGRATDLSYGKELRIDNNRSVLIGEQKHELYETSRLLFYFGEDSDGNPIIPQEDTSPQRPCEDWYIEITVGELNKKLNCPLYDPETQQFADNSKKFRLYENDIRMALSSKDAWKKRTFNPAIFPNPNADGDVLQELLNPPEPRLPIITEADYLIDTINGLMRYNYPGNINAALEALGHGLGTAKEVVTQPGDKPPDHNKEAQDRAVADVINQPEPAFASTIRSNRDADLNTAYEYIKNIGTTYYGKQYLAGLSKDICIVAEGYYDDSYIDDLFPESPDTDEVIDPCTGDVIENINKKSYRPLLYTHTPTNDGGWLDDGCQPILGLGAGYLALRDRDGEGDPTDEDKDKEQIYLDFFRTEDMRIAPFARFDTKDISLNYTNGFVESDPLKRSNLDAEDLCRIPIISGMVQYSEGAPNNSSPVIAGLCGEIDLSLFAPDDIVIFSSYALCEAPVPEGKNTEEKDGDEADLLAETPNQGVSALPVTAFVKMDVEEKVYTIDQGYSYTRTTCTPIKKPGVPDCCGSFQSDVPYSPAETWPGCYVDKEGDPLLWGIYEQNYKYWEQCYDYNPTQETVVVSGSAFALVKFDSPCFKKLCTSDGSIEAALFALQGGLLVARSKVEPKDKPSGDSERQVYPSHSLCSDANSAIESGILVSQATLDSNSLKNKGFCPAADLPSMVVIPLRNNLATYGPWYSSNFESSAGGVTLEQDTDMCPWFFGSTTKMHDSARQIIAEKVVNDVELETGSINYPYWPELPLGFLDNGPNLTNVNVSIGSNGVSTNYQFQSYTPKFGKLANIEKQHLKQSIANKNKVLKLGREKQRKLYGISDKQRRFPGTGKQAQPRAGVENQGTLQRLLIGQMYEFTNLYDEPETEGGEYVITGTGDRTVVGMETLEKSVVELRYDYAKKAFISLDGLYSPVSVSGDGGFPRYAAYSGYENSAKSIYVSPNPPIEYSGNVVNDLEINRKFANPLTNNFASGEHHHKGDGAGHSIDMVARESGIPNSGIVMNFHGQSEWDRRYSDDYRFLGLKGPLVLHAWGYDTQGKPIPNVIDSGVSAKNGFYQGSGLQDFFLDDWLHKPSAWPVGPVDLRFDRQRGMWVSPPQHKLVVVEATGAIPAYGQGPGRLINSREDRKYGTDIFDKDGKLVDANDSDSNKTKITIEDRIGNSVGAGQKAYAMFDNFTSTYLLMSGSGGSNIRIGKFCNQWPSLSNVKDPMNAVKKVVLYAPASGCDAYGGGNTCPWALEPVMIDVDGVEVPQVVEAINLFSNVAAAEYQTKWCAIMQLDKYYYLLAAEC